MRYGSVCSGIEAATAAWHHMGWEPAFFSEIEKFPRAVLEHHYPEVPLHGDFTTIEEQQYGQIDLLVGGTPCQSFSVAGLRGGLDDERGNLALEFCRLAQRERPRWIVWENVPGVLSSGGGRDFGSILGALESLGYGLAYRVLDAQYFGVAQRRRRVFVVGYLGDWRRAAAVLFERHSLSGHPAPSREARQVAPTIPSRSSAGGGLGTDFDCDGGLVRSAVGPLTAGMHRGPRGTEALESGHVIPVTAHTLRGEGFDASEDGTGRGTPRPVPVAFSAKDYGADATEDLSPTLRAGGFTNSHQNGGVMPAVAYPINTQIATRHKALGEGTGLGIGANGDPAYTLLRDHHHAVGLQAAVRRLTPTECERLQGFPDGFTQIPWRKKDAGDCPDGPRYKALGNSMAVPVMAYIGRRIQMVEDLTSLL